MIRGADFSSYQDDAALERALAQGIGFAIVKLTEGTGYVNPRAVHQLEVLRAHGLRCGVYEFLDPEQGPPQWAFFQQRLEQLPHHQELVVAIDYEAARTTDAEAAAFVAAGREAGYSVGLYSSSGTHAYAKLGQAWHWVASWDLPKGQTPAPPWDVWQFAPGRGGDPDWNVFHGDRTRLALFWHAHAGRHRPRRFHVVFPGRPQVVLGPYKTLRAAAARALAYALRHPLRRSYTVTRTGG